MTDQHDPFGWIEQGRNSEACRKATVRALLRALPYIVALLLAASLWQSAAAAPAGDPLPTPYALPAALLVALVCGGAGGFVIGLALEARRSAGACSVCRLNTAEGGARVDLRPRRHVRAGNPPLPCSFSSEHPERTLHSQRCRSGSAARH